MLLHHRRTNRNAKEIKMTYIAIAIVTLFVVSNMPRILLGFEEVVNTKTIIDCIEKDVQYIPSLTFFKVDSVARLLMIVNSSVNFLVYCAGSTAFQVRPRKKSSPPIHSMPKREKLDVERGRERKKFGLRWMKHCTYMYVYML